MSKNPKVTVLLPSYNGEKFISEALKSISDQTFSDLEILVINDGSIDGTLDILNKAKEPRLRIINNEKNLGLVASLNIGIDNALGEYIARMDQDDIALPERLEKQVKFMDSHNDVAACGTWVKTFGKIDGFINKTLTDPEDIKANLLFYTSMAHPTVMIRKSVLSEFNLKYNPNDEYCEDYGLWSELAASKKLANLPEVLLLYQVHKESLSHVYEKNQKKGAINIRKKQLERLGIYPSQNEIRIHSELFPENGEATIKFLEKAEEWFLKILEANVRSKIYSEKSISNILYERWRTLIGLNSELNTLITFYKSPIFKIGPRKKYADLIKILVKNLLVRF
jgi:glycosyltransferase involved in cell wall biosynthesis